MVIATQPNDVMERLSIAYVTAVAARAGCQITKLDIDKQSIDATIRPIQGRKVSIDLQIKSTSQDSIHDDEVIFDLSIKNYDDLRDSYSTAPHYLVVLVLDPDDSEWLAQDESALLIRRCAYWMDLRGYPKTENSTSIRIKLPRFNKFDVMTLKGMMSNALAAITALV